MTSVPRRESPAPRTGTESTEPRLLTIALPLYFVWEMLQRPMVTGVPGDGLTPVWLCGLAAIGDAVTVLLAYLVGCWIFRSAGWWRPPTVCRYATVLTVTLGVQVAVEWIGVHRLGVWSYGPGQPVVPGLEIGAAAVLQSLALPPLVFWLASRSLAPSRRS
jgi:hypothetical protein